MAKKSESVSFEKIISDLKAKVYKPVYFLTGEEPYFIDAITDYIANHVLDESEREFNQSILYGKDIDTMRIISEAKRFPMMADKQVLIIKEAQEIKDLEKTTKVTVGNKKKEEEINLLEEYVKNPQPTTILVICYKYKKLDGRKSLGKSLDKYSVLYTSAKLYDNALPGWIEKLAKSQHLSIAPQASSLMAEYLGSDLSRIANEIEKLKINLRGRKEIQIDDVQNFIGISKDYNVFELQKAIGKRDVVKSNRIIGYFAANPKENPFVFVMANFYSYFSKLLLYHGSPDKSEFGLARAIGVNSFFVKDYELAARIYTPEKLRRIIGFLREYDLKSKGVESGDVGTGELMKELLFKILHC
ncbi:MAG TPA: DNA polymerase III subunit delta [Bacteroidia bacterium]|nr:DNA polymerase III subunit delta [Bacteroidia bacterium]